MFYKLVNKVPVPIENIAEAMEHLNAGGNTVKYDKLKGFVVSTVLLVHHFSTEPTFETLVTYPYKREEIRRYKTYEDALSGHEYVVEKIKDLV